MRHHRGSTLGKDSVRRLELIERNRVLLALKLFPWSLLWLNPFYFAARLAAGFWRRAAGEGDTAHFPGLARQIGAWRARCLGAIWRRCAWPRACCASARAIRAHPAAHAGRGAAADSGPPAEPAGKWHERLPGVRQPARSRRSSAAPTGCTTPPTREFAVVRCGECGLLRLDPAAVARGTAPLLSRQLLVRARRRAPPAAWKRPIAAWCCAITCTSWSRRCASSQARGPLLDVGCGGGLFLGMMRERGFRVVGPRFSREAAAHCVAPAAGAGRRAPMLEHAPFRPGSLAGITMFHVLEHLYDPRAYLTAAHELAGARRPPGGAGAQRRVLAVPPAGPRAGTAWTCRATCSISATATSRSCWKRAASKWCGASISRCATIPAGLASSLAPALDPMARRVRRVAGSGRRAARQGPGVPRAGGRRRCRSPPPEAAFARRLAR